MFNKIKKIIQTVNPFLIPNTKLPNVGNKIWTIVYFRLYFEREHTIKLICRMAHKQ